jgi:hypothetical protein
LGVQSTHAAPPVPQLVSLGGVTHVPLEQQPLAQVAGPQGNLSPAGSWSITTSLSGGGALSLEQLATLSRTTADRAAGRSTWMIARGRWDMGTSSKKPCYQTQRAW